MVDFNISDFSQKVQDYIRANNIDDGDGVIKSENGELAKLIAGSAEAREEIGDMAKFNSPRRIVFDPQGVANGLKTIQNYNNQTPEYRQQVVDNTKADMETALQTLKTEIDTNYEIISNWYEQGVTKIFTMHLQVGGTIDKNYFERESSKQIRDFIDSLNSSLGSFMNGSEKAFLSFGGDFNLNRFESIDYHSALRSLGYSSISDLAKAIAEEAYEQYESDYYHHNIELLKNFYDQVLDDNKAFLTGQKAYYDNKYNSYKESYENSKAALDNTVQNGIDENAAKKAAERSLSGHMFYDNLGEELGIDGPTTNRFVNNIAIGTATEVDAPGVKKNAPKTEKMACTYKGEPAILIVTKENGAIKSAKTLDGMEADIRYIR